MKGFTLSVLCGILIWPTSGSTELYKWTDEQGNLHITDIPPTGSHKKSAPPSVKSSQSAPSQNLPERSGGSGESRLRVVPGHDVMPSPSTIEAVPRQLTLDGLSPYRATVVSSWKIFEGLEGQAKAPVHRWKDARGLEHVTDVPPVGKDAATAVETSTKVSPKLRASVKQDSR